MGTESWVTPEIYFDASQFETMDGHEETVNGKNVLASEVGERGILAAGPYAAVQEGYYDCYIYLEVGLPKRPRTLDSQDREIIKVISESGIEHMRFDLGDPAPGPVRFRFRAKIEANAGYNFVVVSSGIQPMIFSGLRIRRISPPARDDSNDFKILQISLPRSGTHWLYRMISHVIGWAVVDDGSNLTDDPHHKIIDPTLQSHYIITHERASSLPLFVPGWKVIFLTRDVRDAMTSFHINWKSKQKQDLHIISRSKGLFKLIEDYVPVERQNRLYFTHNRPDAVVLYEELLDDPRSELKRVLKRLGIQASEERITEALEKYSFKAVTGREPGEEDPNAHARKGTVGDWKEYLEQDHIQRIREILQGPFLLDKTLIEG